MATAKVKTYKEQSFDHLRGLEGISDAQIAEHLQLYAGYVKQVNTLNAELADLRGKGKASGTNPEFAEVTRRLAQALDQAYDGFEAWRRTSRRSARCGVWAGPSCSRIR